MLPFHKFLTFFKWKFSSAQNILDRVSCGWNEWNQFCLLQIRHCLVISKTVCLAHLLIISLFRRSQSLYLRFFILLAPWYFSAIEFVSLLLFKFKRCRYNLLCVTSCVICNRHQTSSYFNEEKNNNKTGTQTQKNWFYSSVSSWFQKWKPVFFLVALFLKKKC